MNGSYMRLATVMFLLNSSIGDKGHAFGTFIGIICCILEPMQLQ